MKLYHFYKVRSTTLDTWLPEQVAFMQSIGNAKANAYWEAKLPNDFTRGRTEDFIRAKYEENRWVASKATQPIPISRERGARSGIPRKTKNFSLEEEILTKHTQQATHPIRPRPGSLDLNNTYIISPTENGPNPKQNASTVKNNPTSTDLFNLLYAKESPEDSFKAPPRWDTFEYEKKFVGTVRRVCSVGLSRRNSEFVGTVCQSETTERLTNLQILVHSSGSYAKQSKLKS